LSTRFKSTSSPDRATSVPENIDAVHKKVGAWDQINQGEIVARIQALTTRLRHNRDGSIRQKVQEAKNRLGRRGFELNRWDVNRRAGVAANLEFLRGFISGVARMYLDYFKRLGIALGPQDLTELWVRGIEPAWAKAVQALVSHLNRPRARVGASYVEAEIRDLKSEAARIHDRELELWRVKIEEASSHERFLQGKVAPNASKTTESAAGGKQVASVADKLANPSRYPTMNIDEVRQALGDVSRSTIYRWAEEGKLVRAHLGRESGKRSRVLLRTERVKKMLDESPE
jgi:hypothetical protein